MPRYDGPYKILAINENHSTVMLDIPHQPHIFLVFHMLELQPFHENDDELFPDRAQHPPPLVMIDDQQEFYIDKIVDERKRNRATQYLVRWRGEGPEGDKWLPASELEDCEALDIWQKRQGQQPTDRITIQIPTRPTAPGSLLT